MNSVRFFILHFIALFALALSGVSVTANTSTESGKVHSDSRLTAQDQARASARDTEITRLIRREIVQRIAGDATAIHNELEFNTR